MALEWCNRMHRLFLADHEPWMTILQLSVCEKHKSETSCAFCLGRIMYVLLLVSKSNTDLSLSLCILKRLDSAFL